MLHDDQVAPVTEQLQQALSASTALSADQRHALAGSIVQTWRASGAQLDDAETRAVGGKLAAAGVTARSMAAVQRIVVDATPDAHGDFESSLLEGYVAGVKQAARAGATHDLQVTQQREDQLRAVIQELSTPIIPIHRGVLVLPLVGAIDSLRSQEITERLLEEIVRQQADIVIIDITGVSVVDTSVANHLIMTAQAVNLLGSKVIFTGISSTIAQTIVQLGVNLGDVVTLSNLQAGMGYALEQLGLEITALATV